MIPTLSTVFGLCVWLFIANVIVLSVLPDRWLYEQAHAKNAEHIFQPDSRTTFGIFALLLWIGPILWIGIPYYYLKQLQPTAPDSLFWDMLPSLFATYPDYLGWIVQAPFVSAAYFVVGLAWSVAYFSLYARRLGQRYVLTRDTWLAAQGIASLDNLPSDKVECYKSEVINDVRRHMHYNGDFPLSPFQQKRFFLANATLWPLTMAYYFVGELVVDVIRNAWLAVQTAIRTYWEQKMALYLADIAAAKAFIENGTSSHA